MLYNSVFMEQIVEVLPYDPQWVPIFTAEAKTLRSLFAAEVVAVHHIGSTSIPGLKAKPIIDILLEVRDIEQVDAFNEPMRQLGYEPRGEFGLPRRRYFPKTGHGNRTHQVHVWQSGDIEIKRHLAFRDFMIAHKEKAQEYGRLKEDLVAQFTGDREAYMDGKHDFCQHMERQALAWQQKISAFEIKSKRLRLIPLSAAQLEFLLPRPEQFEAELGFAISRPVLSPPVVRHAIRVKQQRLATSPAEEFPWLTYWLMVIKAEPFGAGLIGFKGVPDKNGEVEIGYGIDPSYRRQGYTTEAAGTLINWALQQATCLAVTAWSDKSNRASARVLEKVGMQIARETATQYCWVRS
jgi:GrpB-like predicted nucleotidyltransferase (UPF0157 family)/RimJ/RimL family protein N-acetyltransferase